MGANPRSYKTVCLGSDINFDTLQPCTMNSARFSKLRGWDDLNDENFGGLMKEDVACKFDPGVLLLELVEISSDIKC